MSREGLGQGILQGLCHLQLVLVLALMMLLLLLLMLLLVRRGAQQGRGMLCCM